MTKFKSILNGFYTCLTINLKQKRLVVRTPTHKIKSNRFELLLKSVAYLFLIHAPLSNALDLNANDIVSVSNSALPLANWFTIQMANELENKGIKQSVDGFSYQEHLLDSDDDCDRKKRHIDVLYSINFSNSTHLIPVLTKDTSVLNAFDLFTILDANSNVAGYWDVKPSDWSNVIRICQQRASYRWDYSSDQNGLFSAQGAFNVTLNPYYIPPSSSLSGKPEIGFHPSGNVNLTIGNYDPNIRSNSVLVWDDISNPKTSADVNLIFSTYGKIKYAVAVYEAGVLVLPCLEVSTCAAALAITAILSVWDWSNKVLNTAKSYVVDEIVNPKSNSFFAHFSGTGYPIDISNKLSSLPNVILPDEQTIVSSVLPQIMAKNTGYAMVSGDALKQPGQALYDFLIGDKAKTDIYIEQTKKYGASVTTSINVINSLLLEDDGCKITVTPTTQSTPFAGGSDYNANVTAPQECSWTAKSNVPWLTIILGGTGQGEGTVQYQVAANTVFSPRSGTITVTDDNSQAVESSQVVSVSQTANPVITINKTAVLEGALGSFSYAAFKVSLSDKPTQTITVDYATKDGTAKAGSDYTAQTGRLTFLAGQISKIVRVQVIGDNVREKNETFSLVLNNPKAPFGLINNAGVGTIRNDD